MLDFEQTKLLAQGSLFNSWFEIQELPLFTSLYTKILFQGVVLPPPGMVHDLFSLIFFKEPPLNRERIRYDEEVFYKDYFLIPLKHSQEMRKIREMFVFESQKQNFLQRVIVIFFTSLCPANPLELDPGYVKDAFEDFEQAPLQRSLLFFDPAWIKIENPSPWVENYRQKKGVFAPVDFWELSVVGKIHSDPLRFALKDCLRHQEWFLNHSNALMHKIRLSTARELDKHKQEAGFYPVGGIDEITNKGGFENLLLSELAWSDVDDKLDLFEVRYLEGELLYYQRDSNQVEQHTKKIHLLFFPGSSYPGRDSQEIHPFFLFALIDYWLAFSSRVHPGWEFHFHITFLSATSQRNLDFSKVLDTLLKSRQEAGKLKLEIWQENTIPPSAKDEIRIYLGKKSEGDFSFYWDEMNLYHHRPESRKIYKFNPDELMNWVICFFEVLFLKLNP